MEDETEGRTTHKNFDTGGRCDAGCRGWFWRQQKTERFRLITGKYRPLNDMKRNPLTTAGIGNKKSQYIQ